MRRARACLEATVKRDPNYAFNYAEAWAIFTRILQINTVGVLGSMTMTGGSTSFPASLRQGIVL
jgi:hypothetical protein